MPDEQLKSRNGDAMSGPWPTSGPMSAEELVGRTVAMATPLDFTGLIRRGVLRRRSKSTYTVLRLDKLPPDALQRCSRIESYKTLRNGQTMTTRTTITIKDESARAQRMLDKWARQPWAKELIERARENAPRHRGRK